MHLFLSVMLVLALGSAAQAGNQLFEGSWSVKAFGNECAASKVGTTGGTAMLTRYPHCDAARSGESEFYSAFGLPQGIQCNPWQPRCPFESTPTDGNGVFAPLGGQTGISPFCAPWYNWQGNGTTMRPAKGGTETTGMMAFEKFPPLYRNPRFFTSGGQPNTTFCTAASTGATPGGKGLVQAGQPIEGKWGAVTTGTPGIGGFYFAAAPAGAAGVRTTDQIGEFFYRRAHYPYVYSYTYATLRNDAGVFGPGKGPGDFSLARKNDGIYMKQGAAKFGGTMTLLGALTSKVCKYRNGGCSLAQNNWRYDAIGTSAPTLNGVVTKGYLATYEAYYYHTGLNQKSTINVEGSRFPWTTGSVTVTATRRGPHKTVHYAQGYDNRTASGKGTIQMVTPVLTRWLRPYVYYETGGIGILKIKFVPEPQMWTMLVAGVALLCVGYRMRGR
jgi:hypothetical protein